MKPKLRPWLGKPQIEVSMLGLCKFQYTSCTAVHILTYNMVKMVPFAIPVLMLRTSE